MVLIISRGPGSYAGKVGAYGTHIYMYIYMYIVHVHCALYVCMSKHNLRLPLAMLHYIRCASDGQFTQRPIIGTPLTQPMATQPHPLTLAWEQGITHGMPRHVG